MVEIHRHEIEVGKEVRVVWQYELVCAIECECYACRILVEAVMTYRPIFAPSGASAVSRIPFDIMRMLFFAASTSLRT